MRDSQALCAALYRPPASATRAGLGLLALLGLVAFHARGRRDDAALSPPAAPTTATSYAPAEQESPPSELEDTAPAAAVWPSRNTVHFRRQRFEADPTVWRNKRKKMTELTSITTLKHKQQQQQQQQQTGADDAESEVASQPPSPAAARSTFSWLSARWYGTPSSKDAGGDERSDRSSHGDGTPTSVTASDVVAARARRRQRRRSRGIDELCLKLHQSLGVTPRASWDRLPPKTRKSWVTLDCDARVEVLLAAAGGRTGASSLATPSASREFSAGAVPRAAPHGGQQRGRARAEQRQQQLRDRRAEATSTDAERGADDNSACTAMAREHHVVVGASWGTLPESERTRWTTLQCDRQLRALPQHHADSSPVPEHVVASAIRAHRPRARGGARHPSCLDMQVEHGVRVGSSWGTLPPSGRQRWTRLACDQQLA